MKKITILIIILRSFSSVYSQELVSTLIEREAAFQHFNGTALVIKNNQIVFNQSYGYADHMNKTLNTNQTAFDIGSVSKQFTAAGILHLVHQNKLKLDDNINTHLGKYASKKWKKVTVHQLLSHSSGIPSLFQSQEGTDDIFPSEKSISSEKLVNSISSKKLKFKPGSRYRYSNTGYLLLALIVENISGKTYKEYMQTEIFNKYGLLATTFGQPTANFAKPYFNYHEDITQPGTLFDKSWMLGAGGIYSTAGDLAKWLQIINSDDFLTNELRELYFAQHVKTRNGYYGYGWDIKNKYNRKIFEHNGTNMGYISYCGFNKENNEAIILLTNQSYPTFETVSESDIYIQSLANKVWQILEGEEITLLPQIESSEAITSSYQFEDGFLLDIILKNDNKLLIQGKGDYTPSRMIYQHTLTATDTLSQRVLRISEQLELKKFRKIADICDKQMKTVVKTGVMKLGYGLITSDLGDIHSVTPYFATDHKGKVRLVGENGMMDIDLYFNDKNELMGIFEGGFSSIESANDYITYQIGANKLYMDGFPYGEEPAIITLNDDQLVFEQLGRQFVGQKINK